LSETETLGSIAFDQRTPAVSPLPIAAATAPGASNSIAFRMLASKVAFGDSGDPSRSVVITAVNEGDSAVAATGLAAAIAASGYRVVVVDGSADADVTTSLRLERRPGLAEAIASGSVDPDSLASGPAGIRVLPRGLVGPVDLIPVDKARATLAALLETHDIVIVDGGPAQRSAGALTWARIADRTILLARKGVARRRDLRDAVDSLRYVNAELSGTIIVRRVADRRLARGGSRTASDRVAAPVPGADLSFHEPSPEMAASLERRLAPQPPLVLEPQLVAAPVPEPRSTERGDVAPPPQPKRVERPPSLDDLPIGTLGAERTAASTPRSRAAGPSATSPVDGSGAASGAPSPRPAAARASRRSAGEPAPGDPTRSGSDSPAPAPATARRGRATSGRAGVDRTDGLDGPAVARGAATGARRSRDEG
ncbi:MAG TPA: hypothetical protein VFI34_12605, partial [Candidatus Limnocylindrales bacterium]|nr:hypothetical protein [Candidatus Limnocylindrales bacterium]